MNYFVLLAYFLGLVAVLAGVSSIAYGFYGMTVKKSNRSAILFRLAIGFTLFATTFSLYKIFCV